MWQADPFKAKWSILAKAYSLIRDNQGKVDSPLDQFLAINGPVIGIIEPEHYLQAMSWEIVVDGHGQHVMRKMENSIDEHLFINNVSVNDIILNSSDQGYFTGNLSEVLLAENEATMTMAASEQPTTNLQQQASTNVKDDGTGVAPVGNKEGLGDDDNDKGKTTITNDSSSNPHLAADINQSITDDTMVVADGEAHPVTEAIEGHETTAITNVSDVATITIASPAFDPNDISLDSPAMINADTDDVQYRSNNSATDPNASMAPSAFHLDAEYPFNNEFDPDLSSRVFDPFTGNQFDAFDVSCPWDDLIDFNACAAYDALPDFDTCG